MDEVRAAGAAVIDPIEIPKLRQLLAQRRGGGFGHEAFDVYFNRSTNPPFRSQEEMVQSPEYSNVMGRRQLGSSATALEFYQAREELMFNVMKAMADLELDAIVYKSVEHQPTLISEGVNPPYVDMKGATSLNTFLVYVPAISVPAGFTSDGLPVAITFQGRPYRDGTVLKLAYAYEQATMHRRAPATTPPLLGEP